MVGLRFLPVSRDLLYVEMSRGWIAFSSGLA